jgi:DNA-binding response OmpR family regulator
MPTTYSEMVSRLGFTRDPLRFVDAGQELEILAALFETPTCMAELLGFSTHPTPRSCLVFGAWGSGKTAFRLALGRQFQSQYLVVSVEDGHALLDLDPGLSPLVRYLRERSLVQLHKHVRGQSALLAELQATDSLVYDQLWLHWQAFAPEGIMAPPPPPPSPDSELLRPSVRADKGPRATLQTVAQFAVALKLNGVLVLLDALDDGLEPGQFAELIERLSPLLSNRGLLTGCGFTFCFFLPEAQRELLRERGLLRPGLPDLTLTHDTDALRRMLNRRLQAHSASASSSVSAVERFADLCAEHGHAAEAALLHAAAGNPRELLLKLRAIFARHCAVAEHAERRIALSTVEHVTGPIALLEPAPPVSVEPPDLRANGVAPPQLAGTPLLALHVDGSVSLGGVRMRKPIYHMPYKLLELLWRERGKQVSYEAALDHLYKHSQVADPRGAFDRLVSRLREQLEPDLPDSGRSRTYVDRNNGNGLVLRNYGEPSDPKV